MAVELGGNRPRPLVEHAGPDERDHGPLVRPVDHLGLHADAEAIQGRLQLRAESGVGVEPHVVADHQQPERDVELALRCE